MGRHLEPAELASLSLPPGLTSVLYRIHVTSLTCLTRITNTFTSIYNLELVMSPRTPRPLKCSIGRRVGTNCGLSARNPLFKEYFPILYCKRDVTVHLKRLNVSSSSLSSESKLILLRSGRFDEQGDGMTVCPKHRDVLGLSWRPSRFCTHPLHGFRIGKCDTGVSKKMSQDDEVEQIGFSWIRWSTKLLFVY